MMPARLIAYTHHTAGRVRGASLCLQPPSPPPQRTSRREASTTLLRLADATAEGLGFSPSCSFLPLPPPYSRASSSPLCCRVLAAAAAADKPEKSHRNRPFS